MLPHIRGRDATVFVSPLSAYIFPGVVDNGLFIDVCSAVIVGYSDGTAEISWKKDIV